MKYYRFFPHLLQKKFKSLFNIMLSINIRIQLIWFLTDF